MTYAALALLVIGVVVWAGRGGRATLSEAIVGFARSMDKTSVYGGSRYASRARTTRLR